MYHHRTEEKGVGTYLLKLILDMGTELSEKIGFRFVTVDAYIAAYNFYKKNYCNNSFSNEKLEKEFKKFEKAQQYDPQTASNMTVPMFVDLYIFKKDPRGDYDP